MLEKLSATMPEEKIHLCVIFPSPTVGELRLDFVSIHVAPSYAG